MRISDWSSDVCSSDLGQRQRLPDVHRGPRQPRLRRAAGRGDKHAGCDLADARHGLPDHQLPGQRAAARRGSGSGQGQGPGRAADGTLRHAADLSRLDLRQRLQQVRPHLAGDRAGRCALPRRRAGHRQPAHTQRPRRDGADRSMVKIHETYGPDPVLRYNGYPAADLAGEADPRVLSSAQAMGTLEAIASKVLPNGMAIEWTDLNYQQSTQGNAALVVFPLAILLAFLMLAALSESWTRPPAVILIVPTSMR